MQKNWQVGALFGIPLFVDRSWFLILFLVTSVDANDVAVKAIAGSTWLAWLMGLTMALLLFLSVLLHELGHSLTAQAQGIQVKSITLFLFGGLASIERESKTPFEAFAVAIAGPLVSLAIFGLCYGIRVYSPEPSLINFFARDISRINLILALFNLVPGLPLDGGQMLKAIIWKATGDRLKGVRYAATSGKLLGSLAVALGLFVVLLAGDFMGLWVALLGWFIFRNASSYERFSDLQSILLSLTAHEVMTRDFRVVNAHLSLVEFTEKYVLPQLTMAPKKAIFASSEGRYRGLIRSNSLQNIERSQWDSLELNDIAIALEQLESVTEDTNLAQVICRLEALEDNFITVLSPAGAVAGIIDRAQITQAIAKQYGLELSPEEIQKIRAERIYPKGFPVVEIAAQLQDES
ncbi:site-2 protease family protein [[Limnothrix rosea] IAM M-220]|uniref:site-2 protease family protein n=1 Tax=[Limnothrix rosea] IAM M-220 TaxID=454133 RepID=UPI000961711D|nr:site-2 protease family protein [[Limnothrix rosea] IAM M-220]OKH17014.1 site-2 protease family protein [[Limnothrix rosea] IAM M-220]